MRRCRVGFSITGTTRDFGLTVGVGQYVDVDALPEHIRTAMPENCFEPPAVDVPAPTRSGSSRSSRRVGGHEVNHGD